MPTAKSIALERYKKPIKRGRDRSAQAAKLFRLSYICKRLHPFFLADKTKKAKEEGIGQAISELTNDLGLAKASIQCDIRTIKTMAKNFGVEYLDIQKPMFQLIKHRERPEEYWVYFRGQKIGSIKVIHGILTARWGYYDSKKIYEKCPKEEDHLLPEERQEHFQGACWEFLKKLVETRTSGLYVVEEKESQSVNDSGESNINQGTG